MKNLVLDFDDTVVSFCQAWVKWLKDNNFTEKEYTLDEVISYDWFSKHFGQESKRFFLEDPHHTYNNLVKPIPESLEFINWAKQYFNVKILTHACKKETEEAKLNFCKKHFNMTKVEFFSNMEDKFKFIGEGILVDDYPVHVLNTVGINKQVGIVFDYKGNNGWSKLERYSELKNNLKIKQHIPVVSNYNDLKVYLKGHI